ncbi:hypothetical protein EYF80_016482 [Liparis tanakae]|uniref:Uncharacterized protein n=1 Tax=Liparis tanakae TaxID=230148 RepID=A0A4Z2I5I9_9TELE|nr:hypothetical protein EYF80_016482 [Liparis tanakae]
MRGSCTHTPFTATQEPRPKAQASRWTSRAMLQPDQGEESVKKKKRKRKKPPRMVPPLLRRQCIPDYSCDEMSVEASRVIISKPNNSEHQCIQTSQGQVPSVVDKAGHDPSQLQQHHPDTVGVLPLGQCSHRIHVNLQGREQTPAHGPISHTFLAFFQLLQEPEIARDFDNCLKTQNASRSDFTRT